MVEPFSNRPERRPRGSGSSRASDPLDERLDRWMTAGRQLVDGVSGARPGGRSAGRGRDGRPAARPGFEGLGRWVEDRLDWLLEEEDDWREPWQQERPSDRDGRGFSRDPRLRSGWDSEPRPSRVASMQPMASPGTLGSAPLVERQPLSSAGTSRPRRALEAMSRRQERPRLDPASPAGEAWPEAEDFQVSRWQRSTEARPLDPVEPDRGPSPADGGRGGSRPLPRSSRRRD